MITHPLVCICIPNYNNELTISETLDSLLNQTYKNIIIKIFDNASTDNSIVILKKYEKKYHNIQVFQNEINIGGEANFTQCIQNGEGKYTAVFHADDLYLPTMVEEQVQFLEGHFTCSAVAVHAYTIDENSYITGERFLPMEMKQINSYIFENEIELLKMTLKYGNIITCPSVMARTDIFKNKIQKWNGRDYKTSADLDVWLRFAGFGGFGFLLKPLMKYRLSNVSYSYAVARFETKVSDIFLVLNDYIGRNYISYQLGKEDIDNFHFLLFRNYISRTINCMIKGEKSDFPIEIFSKKILNKNLLKKKNVFRYCVGVFIKIIRNFQLPKKIKYILIFLKKSQNHG